MRNTMERNNSDISGRDYTLDSLDTGVYTEPWDKNNAEYCLPKLIAYAHAQGKAPIELTEKERNMFRTN